MVKRGLINLCFIFFVILFIPIFVSASETGCCTNPDSTYGTIAICNKVTEELCCAGADNYDDCVDEHFHEGEKCYEDGQAREIAEPYCEDGCCCAEIGTVTQKARCDGEFHPGETDRDECHYDICEDEGELPTIDIESRQCVYYYCDGHIIPEGPELDESGIDLIYAQGTEGLFEEIDSLITAGIYTDDNYWLASDDGYLYLYDSQFELIQSNLGDYGLSENPSHIDDLFSGITNFEALAAFINKPGTIYFTQGSNIYEYGVDGFANLVDTTDFYDSPSEFNLMSTYASYLYQDYLIMAGYNNKLNFFSPDVTEDPFDDFYHVDSAETSISNIDAAIELYSGEIYPCLMFIGSCDVFSGCVNDSHCIDFNECTVGECLEDGTCIFENKEDMVDCADGNGSCCGGLCISEDNAINSDFHESCRKEPFCDGDFLKFEKDNCGEPCEGDCLVCNEGDCDVRDDDECGEGEFCNEDGQCVDAPDDECSSVGEIRCHPDSNDKIQECYLDNKSIEGESFLRWGDPEECSSDKCEEAVCVDDECVTEFIPSGEPDHDNGCFNEDHCGVDEGGACRCDGNGECEAWCDDEGDCGYLDGPCKEVYCGEDGMCGFDNLDNDTECFKNGDVGKCQSGECVIQTCTKSDDCDPQVCADVSCDDELCNYTASAEGTICEYGEVLGLCSGEGRGTTHCDPIQCDPNETPEDQCPSGECTIPVCADNGYCEKEPDSDKFGQSCELDDGSGGYCLMDDCVECINKDQCSGENEICVDNTCLIDCNHEDGQCPVDDYCKEETGMCVDCLEEEHCEDGEVCHNNECLEGCDIDSQCDDDEVCVDEACVQCRDSGDCSDGKVCNPDTNKCVECVDSTSCSEGEICYDNSCVFECDPSWNLPDGVYCDNGNIVNCRDNDDCESDKICDNGECVVSCLVDEDICEDHEVCDEETGRCIECDDDDECDDNKVCDTETNKCVYCLNDDDCSDNSEGDYCNTNVSDCVECLDSEHCDDGDPCTINECNSDGYYCEESYEETGKVCELDDGEEGFCHQGDCVSKCTSHDECGQGVHDDKEYCYKEGGYCVYCLEKDHCEVDENDPNYECKSVKRCTNEGECEYNLETGTECGTDKPGDDWVCYDGNCIEKCDDDDDCQEDKFCGRDGICIECNINDDCDDGNNCTINTCDNGVCKTENEDDIETRCGDNNEGYCCSGNCVTDVKGDDFDNDCTDWDMACDEATGEVEFEYTNQGELCDDDDKDCTVCNYGYCDHDDDSHCNDGQDCVDGECLDGCQNKCEPGDSECMGGAGARIKECTDHPNIDDCYTWDTPEKCSGDKCEEPYCSDGECGLNPVPSGDSDEDCWNGFGCDGEICRCDGLGYCIALECDTDSDCEDEELPCMGGTCVDGECEYEPKEDGTKLKGGVCCGGAFQSKTENTHFNESCRSDEPKCVGGSYEYVAENEGEVCAGECAVCNEGMCYDNSSLCSQGEECENGECVGCKDSCTEGEARCVGTSVQVCEEVNGCMTWGEIESCDDDGMCTKGDCVDGECVVVDVEEDETDSDCYGFKGCDGNECRCDGEGNCFDAAPPRYPNGNSDNGSNGDNGESLDPETPNGENGRVGDEEDMSLWWLILLIILMVVVIGGFTGAYYYDANYNQGRAFQNINKFFENLKNKLNNLFSKPKKSGSPQAMNKPTLGPIRSGSDFYNGQKQSQPGAASPGQIKSQSPAQAGLSKGQGQQTQAQGKPDTALQKEIYNYLQTLRQKGPDRDKEVELLKKGVSTQKIKELYQMVRKENEKRAERKRKLAKFD